jgi:hypothetical protein
MSQRHSLAPVTRVVLGFALGLGLATFGCTDKDGAMDMGETDGSEASDPNNEADAVTYGGPDSSDGAWNGDDSVTNTTTTSTPDTNDSQEADAVTYAGPDETESIGDFTTGSSSDTDGSTTLADTGTDTAATETDAGSSGSSG